MGKGARAACIATPMLLTIASFITLGLLEIAGWGKGTFTSLYFFDADLSQITTNSGNNAALTTAIDTVVSELPQKYQVYMWNYCDAKEYRDGLDSCSSRKLNFVFDPLEVWGFEISNTTATATTSSSNAIESTIAELQNTYDNYENELIGASGKKALDSYKTAGKWMFIAYQVAFWTKLGTILVGIFAIFSRWGSLVTWILSLINTIFTFGAVLTSTVLFSVLTGALNAALKDYEIKLSLGRPAMIVAWLSVIWSVAATLFWMFSVCCCSGRSNPHHRSNKGGLWNAEPKGQGYGHERGMQIEKTGGGYERVSSPYLGGHDSEQVPLQNYAQPAAGFNPQQGAGYEPYRHT